MALETSSDSHDFGHIHNNQVIIASNRGPIEYYLSQDQDIKYRQAPGGVVTALIDAANVMHATWVAIGLTDDDRFALERIQQEKDKTFWFTLHGKRIKMHYVDVPRAAFSKYYERFSTEILWFLQHYMYHSTAASISEAQIEDAWINGYHVVNRAIADAICDEIEKANTDAIVMLHDFHLCLASSMIRKQHPSVLIQQFLHSPWPDIRYWLLLPNQITSTLYSSLLENDIIGFQTQRDAHNFLDGVCALFKGAANDFNEGTIWWHGRRIWVRVYPTSLSIVEERYVVNSVDGKREAEQIHRFLDKKIVMRVDRIDPIKNIVRGFQAYARMLDEHPELLEEVFFLAFLVPSREDVPIYQRYKIEVFKVIEEINRQYGSEKWQPIHVFLGNNRTRALAALQFYDVLLVNSIADGMNLVAKEGPIVNQRNGVLVLSRTTGAFSLLDEASLPLSPASVVETAQTLYRALTLPTEERSSMLKRAVDLISNYSFKDWIASQMNDIQYIQENFFLNRDERSKS